MYLKISISSEFPLWISIVCLVFGLGLAWLLYRPGKSLAEVKKEIRWLLFVLRASYLSIIAFLLISPFVLSLDPIVEKPILIFAQDKSQSIQYLTDSGQLNEYITERESFIKKCEDAFDLHYFEFGEEIHDGFTSDSFDHRVTNFSELFNSVNDRYENLNVALMVMSSDGLYNRGKNALYSSAVLPFELYSLALGDTMSQKDIWIDKVNHNRLAFYGNSFDVDVAIGASLLNGTNTEVRILKNGKLFSTKNIRINQDDFNQNVTFKIEADEIGLLRFEVVVKNLPDEVSESNNVQYFYVDVLEGQQEVLILSSTPHPDIAALKLAINKSKNFKAKSILLKDFDDNLEPYNLLILNQLPTRGNMGDVIWKATIPRLFVLGKKTSINDFNKLSVGLKIESFRNRYNESTALFNDAFQYFSIDHDRPADINEFPPLLSPFGDYKADKEMSTLFYQKIGRVKTNYPLISFFESDGIKSGVISGEGLWRWRLFDYRMNSSTKLFDGIVQKIVQYLSLREDKSRFRLEVEPSYFENDEIIINAEYYDRTYELNNDFDVEFKIRNTEGKSFEYSFLKYNDSYQLDLGNLRVGEYSWEASIQSGQSTFKKQGTFNVKELQLEKNILKADHAYLYNLSNRNGGKLLYPTELNSFAHLILEEQRFKPVLHYKEAMKELISFKWLFFALLLLFSTEWFIRKYLGLN